MVEFAIVLPVLALLVFGLIDFGLIFNDLLELRQGVRDGARQAAVANFGDSDTCPGSTIAGGQPASVQARKLICRTRASIALDTDDMRVKVCLRDQATLTTCSTSTGDYTSADNMIVVCAMYPMHSTTGFVPFLSGRVITDRVAIRVEQTGQELTGTPDDLKTVQETPLAGQSWDFCVPEA